MRTKKTHLMAGVAILALTALAAAPVHAATEAQKVDAIDKGLVWLNNTQTGAGYWNYGGYEQAATAAAIGAFVSQQGLWGTNAPQYQADVNRAMQWLLNSDVQVTSLGAGGTMRYDGVNPCPGGGSAAYPVVPGSSKCGMPTWMSRREGGCDGAADGQGAIAY